MPEHDPSVSVDHHWNKVFTVKASNGTARYKHLPKVVKSGLVLGQMNADSERSLSLNGNIVTKDRCSLKEQTITGLRSVKEAVRFYDPQNNRPEKIPMTSTLKQAVRASHQTYTVRLEDERDRKIKRDQEEQKRKEEKEQVEKEKKQLSESRKTLALKENDLNKLENTAKSAMEVAGELINDASAKLQQALAGEGVDKNSAEVAFMMMDAAKAKREKAKKEMTEIRSKQKVLEKEREKLLEKVIPSMAKELSKRKSSSKIADFPKKAKKQ